MDMDKVTVLYTVLYTDCPQIALDKIVEVIRFSEFMLGRKGGIAWAHGQHCGNTSSCSSAGLLNYICNEEDL